MDPWRHIEDLAKPTVPPGASDVLAAALASGARGADALDALREWAEARGGLPLLDSLDITGPNWWPPLPFARSALDLTTDKRGVAAVAYLGNRLMAEGCGLLTMVMGGVGVIQCVKRRVEELGVSCAIEPPPPFVRFAATEAIFAHRTRAHLASPERGAYPPHVLMAARPEELDDVLDYWERALRDAEANEPTSATLDRMRRAAKRGDDYKMVTMFEQCAESVTTVAASLA